MTTSPAETKAALLESAVARVRERLDGDQADDLERFVRASTRTRRRAISPVTPISTSTARRWRTGGSLAAAVPAS